MSEDDNDDNIRSWFSGDDDPDVPPGNTPLMPLEVLRNQALKLFGHFISSESGLNPEVERCSFDEKQQFLTLKETEAIVREFSAYSNNKFMAVGGDSREEAVEQMGRMMEALVARIMSNVVAEGVKRDFIDVSFDNDDDGFLFRVNEKGKQWVDEHKEIFENDKDD